uniref:Iron-sulfur cluster transfer protein NUBPL n=1 Tax=Trichuris muris TaxID=70415 RepID=A0A5S6R2E4_TRIMR
MLLGVVLTQVAISLQLVVQSLCAWTAEECRDAGFTVSLLCSSCDDLAQFKLDALEPACRQCCRKEVGDSVRKYPRAIQAFVTSPRVKDWPGLRVQYVRGADPTIKLYDEDGNLAETLDKLAVSFYYDGHPLKSKDRDEPDVAMTGSSFVLRSIAKSLPTKLPIAGVKRVILVASAKGGVGKSTIAVNLAVAMQQRNPSSAIGLLDADVFGPSIPRMMNMSGQPEVNEKKIILPPVRFGVKCMSMGLLVDRDQPIVWRGLMVMSAINTLLRKVRWGPLDCLVVDMPPGTGDTQLSIVQNIPVDGVLLVSTPQDVALNDARKGAEMFRKVGTRIIGLVENMATFLCPHCDQETRLYGSDVQLKEFADELGIDVLGSLPFEVGVVQCCDSGTPIVLAKPDSASAKVFTYIAHKVDEALEQFSR